MKFKSDIEVQAGLKDSAGNAGTSGQVLSTSGTSVSWIDPALLPADSAENLITEVYNETGTTLTKGTVVYINGGHGNLPTITKALATSDATSAQTYGVVRADITNNNNGWVVVTGRLEDLDTQIYSPGTVLYLSSTTAGQWTSTKQYAPAHLVYVGIVVRSHPTQGIVEIKIQNGYELDELHNVQAQSPSLKDTLWYDSGVTPGQWKTASISSILGYTPFNLPSLTSGSVIFSNGTTLAQDNANFFWDDTNNRLGIGTTNPTAKLDVAGDALINEVTVGRGPGNNASNTVIGKDALFNNLSGQQNTAIGYSAGANLTSGGSNVFIGQSAGINVNSGVGNTIIGTLNSFPPTGAPADFSDTLSISKGESNYGTFLPHIWAPATMFTNSTETIILVAATAYRAMFVEYVIEDESGNIRGGYIKAIWNNDLSVVKMTEDTTSSIGVTSNYTFNVIDAGSSNIALQITSAIGDWIHCSVTSRLLTKPY